MAWRRVHGVMTRRFRYGGYALRHDAVDGVRAAPQSRTRRIDGVQRGTIEQERITHTETKDAEQKREG